MYLGIDLGTSSVKVVLATEDGRPLYVASEPLTVSRPRPLWSEQDPDDWWKATRRALFALRSQTSLAALRAVGLTGQMHGAVLLDPSSSPVRPAILWNDGRAHAECFELDVRLGDGREQLGNRIMPGFTAPKLLWVRRHEPENFPRVDKVLLPKDYLRLRMTGDFATDVSDASGTMWLDVGQRVWSPAALEACHLTLGHMPRVYEGPHVTGRLSNAFAQELGCGRVPVVAGAGDNAAGAIGMGITRPGQAILSLGTSGTYFLVTDRFASNPGRAVHAFCHALPEMWHLMSVTLSAAVCLDWFDRTSGEAGLPTLLEEARAAGRPLRGPLFLPYLAGERTPHDDPHATGTFFGLTHATGRAELTWAVLEGVTFALRDGFEALHEVAARPTDLTITGGGSRNPDWCQLIADALALNVHVREGGDVGPAAGAARLASLADPATSSIEANFPEPEKLRSFEPRALETERLSQRFAVFQQLYAQLRPLTLAADDENPQRGKHIR